MRIINSRVLIFARAPEPGRAKTRLIPALGAACAAALQARLIEHTIATACEAAPNKVELHGTPVGHAFLVERATRRGIQLVAQIEGDLGARMSSALRISVAAGLPTLLIGTDCPALTPSHLVRAASALNRVDAVFVPTEDGGYALVGLRRWEPRLFANIEWGRDDVMARTRLRLRELQWRWDELDTLWDVDRPEDYARLRASALMAFPSMTGVGDI